METDFRELIFLKIQKMKKLYFPAITGFLFQQCNFFSNIFNRRSIHFKKFIILFLGFVLVSLNNKSYADVTLTTTTLAAGNINQGSNNSIVYIVQMGVTVGAVNVNNIQFTLNGTLDANDLSVVSIYYNPTAATISGSSLVNNAVATFASGHTYSIPISTSNPIGSAGYFIIAVNVSSSATDNNTIQIDGSTNPVVFGFTTSPNIINSQSNAAGTQTIQASDITLTTSTLAAANINQGTNNNIVYVSQMNVGTEPVNVNNIQFTLNGTLDANDLSVVSIYYNPTAATISGSSLVNNAVATFASGHTYSIPISTSNPVGSAGYFIIAVNVSSSATDNNTIQIDGSTNPVVFGFTTSPNIINSQRNVAGIQTIQASDITLTTSTLAAGNINQGTNNNIVYIAQMNVGTEPVNVNNIQFTLNGTLDANDLSVVSIYYNPTAATISGSSLVNNAVATFASGHTYSIPISTSNPIGSAGYFIIAVNVSSSATDNNTIQIDGATNPVVFGFTTSPNIINSQSNAAGKQTIQASDITLTTSAVAANNFSAGTNNDIVYVTQMSVATEPVNVNNIQFTLNGTFDANDLTVVSIYYNSTAATISGSSLVNNAVATFASGHTYSIPISTINPIGSAGYFIIAVNVSPSATTGNTVKINGLTDPVLFGFTTTPNVTNNQTDLAGLHTLPLQFVGIKAYEKNSFVAVEWKVAAELNIDRYFVERSANGTIFNAIGQKIADGSSTAITYSLADVSPLPGNNFYRINALNKDGKPIYSSIVRIYYGKGKEGFSVYPNPVIKNQQLTFELQNLKKDNYIVSLFNQQGQLVIKQSVEHAGGNSVQTMNLPKMAAGIYSIEVESSNIKFVKPLIIQ